MNSRLHRLQAGQLQSGECSPTWGESMPVRHFAQLDAPVSPQLTAEQGKLADAERYLLRALEEARSGFGSTDSHFAAALNNLAELHRLRRQFDAAVPLYEEALRVLVRFLHP
jgi:tetratricopeptide (TPR) repeat protein